MYVYDTKWSVKTAGPTPAKYNNERTEIFLFGCNKAMSGNPCEGCFNMSLWNKELAIHQYSPIEIANILNRYAPNKYVTIGGGEPTDQLDELIQLCIHLKYYGFHIILYTWKDIFKLLNDEDHPEFKKYVDLVTFTDIIIDGEYKADERLYVEDNKDGFLNSIGSGNQTIWSKKVKDNSNLILFGYRMKSLRGFTLGNDNRCEYRPKSSVLDKKISIDLPSMRVVSYCDNTINR